MIQHIGNVCPVARDTAVRVYLEGDEPGRSYVGVAGDFAWADGAGDAGEGRIESYQILVDGSPPLADAKLTNPKDVIGMTKLPLALVSGIVKAYDAIAHFLGLTKYGSHNYRSAGIRNSTYVSALHRHIDAWWEGEQYDPTDGTPHLANAKACLNIIIEGQYTDTTIDDRPPTRAKALRHVRAEFEALMPKITAQYAHLQPVKHYTHEDDSHEHIPLPLGTSRMADTGFGSL